MTPETLTALGLFAFVSSATPGPNNLMLMASGANYGFARSLPHMAGITLGFMVMILLVGAGLIRVFDLWPPSLTLLKAASVLYLLWLAWKIARATPARAGTAAGRPLTFLQAAAFQWVNPKGWAMALSALSIYAGDGTLAAVGTVALAFALIGLPAIALWTVTGQQIARLLHQPRHLRAFNLTMAGLLVASLYPVLMPG